MDIIYSSLPMPQLCQIQDVKDLARGNFVVGMTRAREVKNNLNSVPHLLIAGQTGGGKSTFLRQFITSLYLNDDQSHFTLIDLKSVMEFQLFEGLPRIDVPQSMNASIYAINKIAESLEYRMKLLKANKCKDIQEYFKKPKSDRVDIETTDKDVSTSLGRHIIVVDEAAEMFLVNDLANAKDIQTARRILSQVARQGRSVGVHLVIATQRPDSRALDSQIKANLTGVLCFQMVNDASSILVLGNGRATDLPPVPGRAIWKCGLEMVEVQTPLLDFEAAEELLKPHRKAANSSSPASKEEPQILAENQLDKIEAKNEVTA